MAGTFTLTGQFKQNDGVTPWANATVYISSAPYPDTTDNVVYSAAFTVVTDATGYFTTTLVTETSLFYRISSPIAGLFSPNPFVFAAPSAGTNLDVTDLVTFDPTTITNTTAAAAAASAAAAAASATSAAAYTTTSVAAFGAVGTSDDTATFAAAIASNKSFYVPPGTYIVNGLTLNKANQTIQLQPGATLKAKTAGTQTILTITANGVKLVGYGATIDGNSVGTTAGSSIYVNAATDCRIEGLTFINCAGININAQGDRVTVANNTITAAGNAAIFVANPTTSVDLQDPLIMGNRIVCTGNVYGIQSHVNGSRAIINPRFALNDISLPALVGSGIGIELYGGNKDGVVVGNAVTGGSIGISVDLGPSISVTGNTVIGSFSYCIEMASAANTVASGNTVDGNAVTNYGISVSNTAGGSNAITGNTIRNLSSSAGMGIHAQDQAADNLVISGNNIVARTAIYLGGRSGQVVSGNVCIAQTLTVDNSAIALDTVTNAQVVGNMAVGYSAACVNAFTGTMNGLMIGPNSLSGGTPADMINGWTPGTNGVGSRLIRGNLAPTGASSVTPGASPYTFTNTNQSSTFLYISGGTVSAVAKNSLTIFTTTGCSVALEPGETCTITYSVVPTVRKDVK